MEAVKVYQCYKVAGMKLNFSKLPHACRKCLVSRRNLNDAKEYFYIHSKYHEARTKEMMYDNYLEKEERKVTHVFGIHRISMYHNFPYFDVATQLPQCSSHDLLEGCAKKWLKLIFENLVKSKFFSWEALQRLMSTFPYVRKDSNNKPPPLRSKKMKSKNTRNVIGTFAEVSNLIRSITQVAYNHILDHENRYWQWLLSLRRFLRFVTMYQISESQVQAMEAALEDVMSFRFELTKKPDIEKNSSDKSGKKGKKGKTNVSKPRLQPPLTYKEHYLRSGFCALTFLFFPQVFLSPEKLIPKFISQELKFCMIVTAQFQILNIIFTPAQLLW